MTSSLDSDRVSALKQLLQALQGKVNGRDAARLSSAVLDQVQALGRERKTSTTSRRRGQIAFGSGVPLTVDDKADKTPPSALSTVLEELGVVKRHVEALEQDVQALIDSSGRRE
jgi:hypothetical protein